LSSAGTTLLLHRLHRGLAFLGLELAVAVLVEPLEHLLLHLRVHHSSALTSRAHLTALTHLTWAALPLHWSLARLTCLAGLTWLARPTPLLSFSKIDTQQQCDRASGGKQRLAHGRFLRKGQKSSPAV
jgi:hypothetical protein